MKANTILLFFLIPIAILAGYIVYALLNQKSSGTTTKEVFQIVFDEDAVVDERFQPLPEIEGDNYANNPFTNDPVEGAFGTVTLTRPHCSRFATRLAPVTASMPPTPYVLSPTKRRAAVCQRPRLTTRNF